MYVYYGVCFFFLFLDSWGYMGVWPFDDWGRIKMPGVQFWRDLFVSCHKKHIKLTVRLRWWFFETFFYLLSPRKLRKMNPSWLSFFWKTNVWLRPVAKSTSSIQDTRKKLGICQLIWKFTELPPILSILTSQPCGYVPTFNHNRKTTHQELQVVGGTYSNHKQKA